MAYPIGVICIKPPFLCCEQDIHIVRREKFSQLVPCYFVLIPVFCYLLIWNPLLNSPKHPLPSAPQTLCLVTMLRNPVFLKKYFPGGRIMLTWWCAGKIPILIDQAS